MNKRLPIIAITLLIVVVFNEIAAGYSFISDLSGKDLGIATDYLRASAPFNNHFIPGLTLFILNDVISLVVAVLAIAKQKHFSLQGCVFVIWIILRLLMVTSFHPLHSNSKKFTKICYANE